MICKKILKCTLKHKYIICSSYINRSKSSLAQWDENLNTSIKLKIEEHWKEDVLSDFKKQDNASTFYVLPMFPYPSGNLHMGHVRVYSISDTIARFQNMDGKNIIHPMGWDAFGLPAENAAITHNIPANQWTSHNISSMKQQLLKLGLNFNWSREINTCSPEYYKWTQYIFLKLFDNGLAYQNKALVNWDPIDQTVLADEQVDELGCSWRSGAKVEKKILTQWFIRTTKYAKRLYDGLGDESLENWKDIINLQQHWIGKCDGVVVTFDLYADTFISKRKLDVWTSQPYKFIYGEFLTVSKENVLTQECLDADRNKFKLSIAAYNPITDKKLPIYISDTVSYPEGRDIYIASPSTCKDDFELATQLNFPIHQNNTMGYKDFQKDNLKAIDIACKKDVGGYFVSSKLKDWLISRQRYWGTPIPIIHCVDCGPVPVPYSDLPVTLPEDIFTECGIHTLTKMENWVNCECPNCHKSAKRETDTMDTFVDSSWYYYRFLDPCNSKIPFDKSQLLSNVPVSIYIGGKEHAVLHLYYARFMSYFLNDLGWTPTSEPFKKLLVQGMVMGKSYRLKSSGRYLPESKVIVDGHEYRHKETGESIICDWEKMSKSKYNGENPENLLSVYGCDTTRLFILADVPPATPRHWSDATYPGVLNWQNRLWITIRDFLKHRSNGVMYKTSSLNEDEHNNYKKKISDSRNYFTVNTTYHFKYTQQLSVGISRLQGLTNVLRNNIPPEVIAKSGEYELALGCLIIMLSPVCPHFCSELWSGFLSAPNRINNSTPLIDWENGVLKQRWPKVDENYDLSLLCKVDGANRCDLKIKASHLYKLKHDDVLEIMLRENAVAKRVKKGILKTKYDFYDGCRGIMYIFTNRETVNNITEK